MITEKRILRFKSTAKVVGEHGQNFHTNLTIWRPLAHAKRREDHEQKKD